MARLKDSKFTSRVLVVAILVPPVITATYIGGIVFASVVLLAALLACYEFFRLMHKGGFNPSIPLGLLFVVLFAVAAFQPEWGILAPGLTVLVLSSLIWELFQAQAPFPTADWALTVAGGIYVGWLISHFISLRSLPDGYIWTMLTFLITWVGDSGAYLVGLKWGKRPLCSRLSPRKTWEGTVGGWLSGVAAALILGSLAGIPLPHSFAIGAIISTLAPFGDLAVSMVKRQVKVKDSGKLFPGHGGMLDRVDSLLFAVVGVYYYVTLVVI